MLERSNYFYLFKNKTKKIVHKSNLGFFKYRFFYFFTCNTPIGLGSKNTKIWETPLKKQFLKWQRCNPGMCVLKKVGQNKAIACLVYKPRKFCSSTSDATVNYGNIYRWIMSVLTYVVRYTWSIKSSTLNVLEISARVNIFLSHCNVSNWSATCSVLIVSGSLC